MHRPLTTPRRSRALTAAAALSLLAGLSVTAVTTTSARADDPQTTRQAEFTAAAQEFGVPLPVLEAVSFYETRWEAHAGQENAESGYGPMNLTDLTAKDLDADGLSTQSPRYADLLTAPAEHTAAAAAALLGSDAATVQSDETQNIRGGAALLASYAKSYGHGTAAGAAPTAGTRPPRATASRPRTRSPRRSPTASGTRCAPARRAPPRTASRSPWRRSPTCTRTATTCASWA